MQYKNKLLGSAIASVAMLAMVGTANAVDIDVTVSGVALLDTTDDANPPLQFANEVASADGEGVLDNARDNGEAVVVFDVSTGTFPSGNVIMQLQLNGATFLDDLDGSDFDFTGCGGPGAAATANVSIGGAENGNTVTFLLSNLNDCENGDNPSITLPFDLNGPTQDASLIMTILTESGNVPVDNTLNRSIPLVEMTSAFDVAINDSGDVIADVEADEGPYLDFTTVGEEELGTVDVEIDTSVYVTLGNTSPAVQAANANVTDVTVTIAGNFAPFTEANAAEIDSFDATVNTAATSASVFYGAGGDTLTDILNSGGLSVTVTPDLVTPIQRSNYTASVLVDLAAGFSDFTTVGSLSPIDRNGTFALLPWTASATQAGGTGSNNFVRVTNPTGQAYGPIFATVLAASAAGQATVGDQVTLAASLGAGEEALFTASDLEGLLGNFGRADIEIAVEGNDAIIARLVQRTDGTYEINNR
jgi:hypothetical protein